MELADFVLKRSKQYEIRSDLDTNYPAKGKF